MGTLHVSVNARARRMTFRVRGGCLHVSVPRGTTERSLREAVEELRPRLRVMYAKSAPAHIAPGFHLKADYFELNVVEGVYDRFLAHSAPGSMEIVCPPGVDYADAGVQTWLRKAVTEALRKHAAIILPPRLYMLAGQHGLTYKSVRINAGKGRWGSCSARGTINLSCYLLLLPQHLIDYVLLHELAHTLEMNHGERFWQLLDSYTGGRARALRAELKSYPIPQLFA